MKLNFAGIFFAYCHLATAYFILVSCKILHCGTNVLRFGLTDFLSHTFYTVDIDRLAFTFQQNVSHVYAFKTLDIDQVIFEFLRNQ